MLGGDQSGQRAALRERGLGEVGLLVDQSLQRGHGGLRPAAQILELQPVPDQFVLRDADPAVLGVLREIGQEVGALESSISARHPRT